MTTQKAWLLGGIKRRIDDGMDEPEDHEAIEDMLTLHEGEDDISHAEMCGDFADASMCASWRKGYDEGLEGLQ